MGRKRREGERKKLKEGKGRREGMEEKEKEGGKGKGEREGKREGGGREGGRGVVLVHGVVPVWGFWGSSPRSARAPPAAALTPLLSPSRSPGVSPEPLLLRVMPQFTFACFCGLHGFCKMKRKKEEAGGGQETAV